MEQIEVKQETTSTVLEAVLVVVVLLLCEWLFFRHAISLDALLAGRGDGRLTMLLTEHWWNYFTGRERFSELAMFYPCEEVFGYTDLFLGYGVIHAFLRLFGLDMYHAYKVTLMVVHLFGTASMYYLMRKTLKCEVVWALFGTIAFCYSNAYAIHIGHTQLNAISFLPLLLILLLGFMNNFEIRTKRNIYGYGLVVWFVLLTYTAWYVACFTGLFCLLFLIVYCIMIKRAGLGFDYFKNKLSFIWKDILGYGIAMAVLYIPFIMVYLPILRRTGGYGYWGITQFMPEVIDIINVTSSNLMLGRWMSLMKLSDRGYSGEETIGFSIILLAFFIFAFLTNRRRYQQEFTKGQELGNAKRYREIAIVCLCLVIVVGIFLPIRLSANGVSLWWFVYKLVPAMQSVRAVGRFLLWLSFPMAVMTAFLMNRRMNAKNKKASVLSVAAVTMLALSNINMVSVSSEWNARAEAAFIHGVASPPSDLESFYITDSSQGNKSPACYYQLDPGFST